MNGKWILWGLGMMMTGNINAQVFDDFSDGNFTQDPSWTGDSLQFEVNSSKQLHLKSSGSDTSVISTGTGLSDSVEWSFWVKCTFSPSASNFCRVYLMADQPELNGLLNGYYLQLGESGSDDAVELFRQSGDQHNSVCRGPNGMLATSFVIRIRVLRKTGGKFEVYADPLGGDNYSLIAAGTDNLYHSTGVFGFFCSYTSSNSSKFYFDDIDIKYIYKDQESPQISKILVLQPDQLEINFNEAVQLPGLIDPLNFTLGLGMGNPVNCLPDTITGKKVILELSVNIPEDTSIGLIIKNITDLAGNTCDPLITEFIYHKTKQFDVLINEIMADPEPQYGLPPCEYIELYNRSLFPVQMNNWKLISGNNQQNIPEINIAPHSFLLLCHEDNQAFLGNFGLTLGLSSFSISNEGSCIRLLDETGHLVSSVCYSPEWHQNSIKKEGGYSLEQIDPLNPCGEETNWSSSSDSRGGTPGKINSVNDINTDLISPEIKKIVVKSPTQLIVYFSEEMDSLGISKPGFFEITPDIGQPAYVHFNPSEYSVAILELKIPLQAGVLYNLNSTSQMTDCAGNILENTVSANFAIPELPGAGDIIINEIMFDPGNSGSEYFELFNPSKKTIDLKDLLLAKPDTVNGGWEKLISLTDEGRQILPSAYLVLSANIDNIKYACTIMDPRAFEEVDAFPTLRNECDEYFLLDRNESIIDHVRYENSWHHPLLVNTSGISLEKISPELPSLLKASWHSAASSASYATPGYINSQTGLIDTVSVEISVEPEIFSPDNNGYNDQVSISFHLSTPGYQATVTVYNDRGKYMGTIINNELLGTESRYFWSGLNDQGKLLPNGIYILDTRLIHPQGFLLHDKKAIALSIQQ